MPTEEDSTATETLPLEVSAWIRSLEDRLIEVEAAGRELARALAGIRASMHELFAMDTNIPQGQEGRDTAFALCEAYYGHLLFASRWADAVLATDTARAWLESEAEMSDTEAGPAIRRAFQRVWGEPYEDCSALHGSVPDSFLPCQLCGREVLEFTIDSPLWNRLVRDGGYPDYLCICCFDTIAAQAGETYEAEFYWVGAAGQSVLVREARDRIATLEAALERLALALSQALAAPLRTDVQMPADKNTWLDALLHARALLATRAGAATEGQDGSARTATD